MKSLLPEGLQFLQIGWWISHVIAIWLIYVWAYRKGRRDEKTARLHRVGPPPAPSPKAGSSGGAPTAPAPGSPTAGPPQP